LFEHQVEDVEDVEEQKRRLWDLFYFGDPALQPGRQRRHQTSFGYLGLTSDLITEAYDGQVTKSYAYTPAGERISQASTSDGTTSTGYYTYNDHADVEAITGGAGTTKSTYGYTAYGQPAAARFTGADKNTTTPSPTAQPLSSYRFNAMRWDSTSGRYDMGLRNYAPRLNQFLTRDMYNGALADMNLATDPFTGNRYTFAAGNPISNIELDGHMFPGSGGSCPPSGCTAPTTTAPTSSGGAGCVAFRLAGSCPVGGPNDFGDFVGGAASSFLGMLSQAARVGQAATGNPAGLFQQNIFDKASSWVLAKTHANTHSLFFGIGEVEANLGALFAGGEAIGALRGAGIAARAAEDAGMLARLPVNTGGKTSGILVSGGNETPLISGYSGPAAGIPRGTPGFNIITRAHVEGHAAAIMRQQELEEATLYINEATLYINKVPCGGVQGCDYLLPRMLPEGSQLRVVGPEGFDQTYAGLPDDLFARP
jgi:RHS repeat-associated protein